MKVRLPYLRTLSHYTSGKLNVCLKSAKLSLLKKAKQGALKMNRKRKMMKSYKNKGQHKVRDAVMFQLVHEEHGADVLHVRVEPLPPGGAALGLCLDLGPRLPGRGLRLLLGPPLLPRYDSRVL